MDEADYAHIVELAEKDEFVDFEIPQDAPIGKRYSEMNLNTPKTEDPDEFVPVDLEKEFGGDLSG